MKKLVLKNFLLMNNVWVRINLHWNSFIHGLSLDIPLSCYVINENQSTHSILCVITVHVHSQSFINMELYILLIAGIDLLLYVLYFSSTFVLFVQTKYIIVREFFFVIHLSTSITGWLKCVWIVYKNLLSFTLFMWTFSLSSLDRRISGQWWFVRISWSLSTFL